MTEVESIGIYCLICMSLITLMTCFCIRALWNDIHEWRKERKGEQA